LLRNRFRRTIEGVKTNAAIHDGRLLKFLRRQVSSDLRMWRELARGEPDGPLATVLPDLIADCKAKLAVFRYAESWQKVHSEEYGTSYAERLERATMLAHLSLIMYTVRYLAPAYASRPGWHPERESDEAYGKVRGG
jgi:hypothetical protein